MASTTSGTLLGWLGRPDAPTPKKVDPRSLSPVRKATTPITTRTVLGILGTRSNVQYEEFEQDVLGPMVEAWGFPDEILVPAESDSTQIILTWAKQKSIPVQLVTADWRTQGRRASTMRDGRIQRDATHLLMLQGPRSNALMNLARRLDRKGRPVVISERPGNPVSRPTVETVMLE
jgi:hypothetical protein